MSQGFLEHSRGVLLSTRRPFLDLWAAATRNCGVGLLLFASAGAPQCHWAEHSSYIGSAGRSMTTSTSPSSEHASRCSNATPKSAKRKAAEALLAARYVGPNDVGCSTSFASGPVLDAVKRHCASAAASFPKSVVVAACPSTCGDASHRHHGWCHRQVTLPHLDWHTVFEGNPTQMVAARLADGYTRMFLADTRLQILMVENPRHVEAAVKQLRESMQDEVLAMDLEWRPDFSGRFTPVALVQLASSTCCLLLRTSRMQYQLPPAVRALLSDPSVQVVGFSWESSDESKMSRTFSFARRNFGSFQDLQQVAEGMGYHGYGLARLAKQVLGFTMPKSKRVSMSNWEAPALSSSQIKYAAMDVFAAGLVYRGLRVWHAEPTPCSHCRQSLGQVIGPIDLKCGGASTVECTKKFSGWSSYQQHCQQTGHKMIHEVCQACGRVHSPALRLQAPAVAPAMLAAAT